MTVADGGTLLAVEEDILVEGRRVEPLAVVDEEGNLQRADTDHHDVVALAEVRQIATVGTLVLVGWHCRVQRWIPSLDQCHFGNDPKCLFAQKRYLNEIEKLSTTRRTLVQNDGITTTKTSPVLVSPIAFCALCALSPI